MALKSNNIIKSKRKSQKVVIATSKEHKKALLRRNIPLFIMLIIPVLYYLIFAYAPMGGLAMAFQNYKIKQGIFGSEWVGWTNFKTVFGIPSMRKIIFNTLFIGILTVVASFPFPIITALLLNEVTSNKFKKFSQTFLFLPHFFSWVILGGMVITCFQMGGPINRFIEAIGGTKIPFLTEIPSWLGVYVGSGIWKEMGYDAIIYLAALTSIDPAYYEAAKVDGASKWQQITKITLPCLYPTIVLMFILAIGKISSVGFDRIYVMENAAVSSLTNVVSVFSYEIGIRQGQYSIATAMGLFDSLLSLILVLTANRMAKKSENQLF